MTAGLPLIPTTVCGSHGLPSWLLLVREAATADRLGPIDLKEAYEDAVRLAMRDQVEAGIDVISDGEMRRVTFIRGFYDRLAGIRPLPIPRRLGAPNYDTHCPYEVVDRITRPPASASWRSIALRALSRTDRCASPCPVPSPCSSRFAAAAPTPPRRA